MDAAIIALQDQMMAEAAAKRAAREARAAARRTNGTTILADTKANDRDGRRRGNNEARRVRRAFKQG